MEFRPPRSLGLITGFVFSLILGATITWSVYQMSLGELTLWLVLWILVPLISLPLLLFILYRLYGLLTARYQIDRDGLKVRWGLASDNIPIHLIERVDRAEEYGLEGKPQTSAWWPGLIIGRREFHDLGTVEYFASRGSDGIVVVQSQDRTLAISPADVEAFLKAVRDALRMGALETFEPTSMRPNFALANVARDPAALILVSLAGVLPISLFAYLLFVVGSIQGLVAFGFDTLGEVDTLAPAGRLLLLPMIGGASWFLDLFFGLWMYRTKVNRPLAYTLWSGSVLVGGLLWGAALHLLGVI